MNGRPVHYFVLLGLLVLLAGCIDSEAPLSDPDKSTLDEKLLGKWTFEEKGTPPSQVIFEKVTAAGYPAGVMAVTMRPLAKNDPQAPQVGFVFRTELKGKTYLNLCGKMADAPAKVPAWDKVRANGFNIFKYAVKDDSLTFWFVDDEAPLKAAVTDGTLKGTVRPQGYLDFAPTVRLKDTTANVADFVAREDEKLFTAPKKVVLTRAR